MGEFGDREDVLDEAERGGLSVRLLVFLAVAAALFISTVIWALTSTSDGLRAPVAAGPVVPSAASGSPVSSDSALDVSPSPASVSPTPSPSAVRSRSAAKPTTARRTSLLRARFGRFPLVGAWYFGSYTITNYGQTTASGWRLVVTFPPGTTVNAFGGGATQNGRTVTFSGSSRSGSIPPGHSVTVMFQAYAGDGGNGQPQSCTINGSAC